MNATAPHQLSLADLRTAYLAGTLSPVEVVDDVLAQLERVQPQVNALATVTADLARAAARDAERTFHNGDKDSVPLLTGIPLTIKDLIPTAGIRTTFGSYVHATHIPEADAALSQRVRAAGAALIGKTTTPEFGWKCPTDSPLFGYTRNPWAPDRTPGGSTGGGAVAVACGLGPVAIGTDGGGSIRQPASFCGIVGLKPSFGRIPCGPPSGVIDVFNTSGILARNTRDVALVLDLLAGEDEEDWYSLPPPAAGYGESLDTGIAGARVAWSADLGYAPVDPEVAAIARAAALRFTELGCDIEQADPPWADPASWFEVICMRMMALGLRGYLAEWRDQMDPELVAAIGRAENVSVDALVDAARERLTLQAAARSFFSTYDLLLTPTMSVRPFELGLHSPVRIDGRPVQGMQWTPFTYPFNITGYPAASVPAGWTADGLPVGLQIVAGFRKDELVLRASHAFETLAPWHDRWPPVSADAAA